MAANNRGKSFKKFDLDLELGEKWEDFVDKGMNTAEVKTENGTWEKYGNIVIECNSYGKPSGIDATESDLWIHNLVDSNGNYVMGFILPTPTLRGVCANKDTVMGGDHGASELIKIAIENVPYAMINKHMEMRNESTD